MKTDKMTDWTGEKYRLRLTGASHDEYVGAVFSGMKKGEKIDFSAVDELVTMRRPCENAFSTKRRESDEYEFIGGVDCEGVSTGDDLVVRIKNRDVRKGDYEGIRAVMRPSHADYAAFVKYGESALKSGGGIFSGRMTAPLCVIGGVALGILKKRGVSVTGYLSSVGDVRFGSYDDESFVLPEKSEAFALADERTKALADDLFARLAKEGDSVGGIIECVLSGVPAGVGDAQFGCLESRISSLLFGIPAVKAVEFGFGKNFGVALGSEVRDEPYYDGDKVKTRTNFNGGINGGISNGMPIAVRVTVKPTPSIAKPCRTINVNEKRETLLEIKGRHDVCIAPRAVAAVVAAASIALFDAIGEKYE